MVPTRDDVDGHEGVLQLRREAREPQIADFEVAVGVDQQVVRLQIPVSRRARI